MGTRLLLVLALVSARARAQPAPPEPPVPSQPEPAPPAQPDPPAAPVDLSPRVQTLEQRVKELEDELAATQEDATATDERVTKLLPITGKLTGYIDVGFFATNGNGAGTRSDLMHRHFPNTWISSRTRGCSWATRCRPRSTRAATWPTPVRRAP